MSRRISHSEERWKQIEAEGSVLRRCLGTNNSTGQQCKRVALAGSVMCDRHTSHLADVQKQMKEEWLMLAPDTYREAKRILNDPNASDTAKTAVIKMVNEASGINEAKKVVLDVTDPVEKLFRGLLDDPDALNPQRVDPPSQPAALNSGVVVPGEVVERSEASRTTPVDPENIVPINGWAAVDNATDHKPSKFDASDNAADARQKAKIPKRVRDTYDDAS